MIFRSHVIGLVLAVAALAASGPCPGPNPPSKSLVRIQQIDVPQGVFSISGEVAAFRAEGEAGRTQKVTLPLDSFRARFGNFKRALLFEFDHTGRRLSRHTLKLAAGASVSFRATTGNTYLVYFDLNERLIPSYELACRLGRMGLRGGLVPRLCTQIYCNSQPFRASQLAALVPGAGDRPEFRNLGRRTVGGFGASGEVCTRCLENTFYPTDVCSLSLPVAIVSAPEEVVYQHAPYDPAGRQLGRSQIYKMRADGSHSVNLSNSQSDDSQPDVSPDGRRIVFVRDGSLYLMDIDGRNVTAIPDTSGAVSPRWGRGADPFIVYVDDVEIPRSHNDPVRWRYVIFSIRPDGAERQQLTPARDVNFPLPVLLVPSVNYLSPDVLADGRHVIFTLKQEKQLIPGAPLQTSEDLYLLSVTRDRGARLTITDDLAERSPVVSRGGELIAYAVPQRRSGQTGHHNQIHVARLTASGEDRWALTPLHVIRLDASFAAVTGLSFSNDDTRLYFSAEIEGGSSEIFSVKLDGSDLRRLSHNVHLDGYPSAVPK